MECPGWQGFAFPLVSVMAYYRPWENDTNRAIIIESRLSSPGEDRFTGITKTRRLGGRDSATLLALVLNGIAYGVTVEEVDLAELDPDVWGLADADTDFAGIIGEDGVPWAGGRALTMLDCRYTTQPTTVPFGTL